MKKWKIEGILTDDGIEDPDGEIKGKYFTKAEIRSDFSTAHLTAGLAFRITKLTEVKLIPKGGGRKAGARKKRQ